MSVEPKQVHQLIYVSAATVPFSGADLTALLVKARNNNRRLGVSGLLVQKSGSFFQVLEGDKAVVETLFELIERDKRHAKTVVLLRGSAVRAFPSWTMGFVEADHSSVARVPGFNDFWRSGFMDASDANRGARARTLALAFRDGSFRKVVDGA